MKKKSLYRQTMGAKIHSREGKSPEQRIRSLNKTKWNKGHFEEKTKIRWAWKQPSDRESVKAQCLTE